MDASEIKDRESFRAWLSALPQGDKAELEQARHWAVKLRYREGLRMLPMFWAIQLEDNLKDFHLSILPILRVSLTSGVTAKFPTQALYAAIDVAQKSARQSHGPNLELQPAIQITAQASYNETLFSLRKDCEASQSGETLETAPLWHGNDPLAHVWTKLRTKILAQGDNWRFWVDWYDNALHGRKQDYDLLPKIARIESADWNKGADHVNSLIQQIVEQHRLAGEARALKAEIDQLKAELRSLQHRSHNNPPELVDDALSAQQSVTIIWAALDEAEQELEKPAPDQTVVNRIAEVIINAAKAIGAYCASLADDATRTAIKAGTTGAVGLAVLAQQERLAAFGAALRQLARTLGN